MDLRNKKTGEIVKYENGVAKGKNYAIECTLDQRYWEEVKYTGFEVEEEDDIIVSVKRMSDGVIFSVGDRLFGNNTFIKSIDISKRWREEVYLHTNHYSTGVWLVDAIKVEKHYTLVEGVLVGEGDPFYIVNLPKYSITKSSGGHFKKEDTKRIKFLLEEDAKEFAYLNAPTISIKNLKDKLGTEITNKFLNL